MEPRKEDDLESTPFLADGGESQKSKVKKKRETHE